MQQQQQHNNNNDKKNYNTAYRPNILYYIYIRDKMADEFSSAFCAPYKLLLVASLNLNLQPNCVTSN